MPQIGWKYCGGVGCCWLFTSVSLASPFSAVRYPFSRLFPRPHDTHWNGGHMTGTGIRSVQYPDMWSSSSERKPDPMDWSGAWNTTQRLSAMKSDPVPFPPAYWVPDPTKLILSAMKLYSTRTSSIYRFGHKLCLILYIQISLGLWLSCLFFSYILCYIAPWVYENLWRSEKGFSMMSC